MKKTVALAISLGLCLTVIAPAFSEQGYTTRSNQNNYTAGAGQSYGSGGSAYGTQTARPAAPEFKLVKTFQGEDAYSILRPAFSRDGKYLAANLNETKTVRIWDAKTGDVVADLSPELLFGANQLVDGLEFTKDNNHIVVLRAGYPLKEIDWRTKQVVRNIDLGIQGNKIEDYAFCPMFKLLGVAAQDGLHLYDFETGKQISTLFKGEPINAVDVSRDGRWLAFAKKGDITQSVGLYDLKNQRVEKFPIASFQTPDNAQLQNYQVRTIGFDPQDNSLMVGYMELPQGQFKPTGPAGVFRISLRDYSVSGPEALSSSMLSFDPVSLDQFHTTFFNTFEFNNNGTTSAADFVGPDLAKTKTMTNADFDQQAPMLTFRVSPDQKWMAGSFKEPDGKVRLRLYQISPATGANN